MKILLKILILTIFSGCASLPPTSPPDFQQNHTLWYLRITHHKQTLFSGLLSLKKRGEYLRTVVLDTTGITIMTGRLDEHGKIKVCRCLAPARDHDLPGLLGPALARIFYQTPGQDCFLKKKTVDCRSGLWPLSLWKVSYFSKNKNSTVKIVHRAPGADIVLRLIEEGNKNK
ncbi:MAG: hypothetical protein ACQES8_08180 [Thermodesulfobacteriota bacterium]